MLQIETRIREVKEEYRAETPLLWVYIFAPRRISCSNLGIHNRPCVCQSGPAIASMNLDQLSLESTSLAEFALEKALRYLADLFVKM